MINEDSAFLYVHRGFSPRKGSRATENSRGCYRGALPAAPAKWGGKRKQSLPEADPSSQGFFFFLKINFSKFISKVYFPSLFYQVYFLYQENILKGTDLVF